MLMYMMDVGMELEILHGSRILEFTDSLGLVICSMCFMKQDSKLVSYYELGPNKSTVD